MVAQKIDGTAIAKSIRERLNNDIQQKQEKNPRYKPSLIIIQGMHVLFFFFLIVMTNGLITVSCSWWSFRLK